MISSPIRVPRMPRSCRMGRSVPMAVVVSAMTTARPSSSKADSVGQMATTTNAMAKVTAQVAAPRFPSVPVRFFGDIS